MSSRHPIFHNSFLGHMLVLSAGLHALGFVWLKQTENGADGTLARTLQVHLSQAKYAALPATTISAKGEEKSVHALPKKRLDSRLLASEKPSPTIPKETPTTAGRRPPSPTTKPVTPKRKNNIHRTEVSDVVMEQRPLASHHPSVPASHSQSHSLPNREQRESVHAKPLRQNLNPPISAIAATIDAAAPVSPLNDHLSATARSSARPDEPQHPDEYDNPVSSLPGIRYIHLPDYPDEARWEGREGRVTLRFRIRRDGTVDDIEVQTTSGQGDLDTAAKSALRDWRFESPDINASSHWYQHSFRFALD